MRGRTYPREDRIVTDPVSGRRVRQVTTHPAIHHHPFFFVPAYDAAMRRLVFVSYRTGAPQVFFEDRASGELVQVTARGDLAEWSVYPSADGRFVYYTAGPAAWRTDLETLDEEQLADFGAAEMREKGMVGAAMGTTALSASGRYWAVPVKTGPVTRFVLIDTQEKRTSVILERNTVGHPQFCPADDDLILYAGPLTDRVWVTDRSGTKNCRLYAREDRMQWVTHEVWTPDGVAFVDWPRGMRLIDVATGAVRWLTRFPAWHAAPDHTGTRFVCDTNIPDRGLHVIDISTSSWPGSSRPSRSGGHGASLSGMPATSAGMTAENEATFLCASEATSEGAHWAGPFPYNDGPVVVEARQHTHPHPRFSPDGARVVFTSDRTGWAQVYEVEL